MHSIEIGSDLNNIPEVEGMIDQICEDLNLSEDYYGNILIAVTEAVNNAIIHGNREDSSKQVVVQATKKGQQVIFSVKDQGNGFDFNDLPDPTAPENLEKPDGRGIYLMKNLSDKVEFEDEGSKVNITFVVNE